MLASTLSLMFELCNSLRYPAVLKTKIFRADPPTGMSRCPPSVREASNPTYTA